MLKFQNQMKRNLREMLVLARPEKLVEEVSTTTEGVAKSMPTKMNRIRKEFDNTMDELIEKLDVPQEPSLKEKIGQKYQGAKTITAGTLNLVKEKTVETTTAGATVVANTAIVAKDKVVETSQLIGVKAVVVGHEVAEKTKSISKVVKDKTIDIVENAATKAKFGFGYAKYSTSTSTFLSKLKDKFASSKRDEIQIKYKENAELNSPTGEKAEDDKSKD